MVGLLSLTLMRARAAVLSLPLPPCLQPQPAYTPYTLHEAAHLWAIQPARAQQHPTPHTQLPPPRPTTP